MGELCKTSCKHNTKDLSDIDVCEMKCSSFISSFNKLHCYYASVQPCILSKTGMGNFYASLIVSIK